MIKLDVPEKAEYYFKGKYDTCIYIFPKGIFINYWKRSVYCISGNSLVGNPSHIQRLPERAFIPVENIIIVEKSDDFEVWDDLEVDKSGYLIDLISMLCVYLSEPLNRTDEDEPETFIHVMNSGEIIAEDLFVSDIVEWVMDQIDYQNS